VLFLASLNDIIKTEYFMRKILIIAGILLCCLNMQAQDMKSLFVALPDSLSPLLTEVNRADFGDCQQYEGSGEKPFWKHVGNVEADR
jgi:hypothetical protein